MVWPALAVMYREFDRPTQFENIYALLFKQCCQARLVKAEDIAELLLSFILAPNGLKWYDSVPQGIPEIRENNCRRASQIRPNQIGRQP
jgi:hypothetical protein